jgi:hypothetical protein
MDILSHIHMTRFRRKEAGPADSAGKQVAKPTPNPFSLDMHFSDMPAPARRANTRYLQMLALVRANLAILHAVPTDEADVELNGIAIVDRLAIMHDEMGEMMAAITRAGEQ